MQALISAHSGLRWIALLLLLLAIFNAFTAKDYEKKHRLVNLFTMITFHTQLLLGAQDGCLQQVQSVFAGMCEDDLDAALDVLLTSAWDGPLDTVRSSREEFSKPFARGKSKRVKLHSCLMAEGQEAGWKCRC